jgi:UDP-N-acetylmuramoyl-L-alanyl-D-glutamate--2,6-diaminopimelate ligase
MNKDLSFLWELARSNGCSLPKDPPENFPVTGISIDTRTLRPGDLFVALQGTQFDSRTLKTQALDAGAAGVIDDQLLGAHTRRFIAIAAQAFLPEGSKGLKWVGVTGTSGKTSTTFLLTHLLNRLQAKPLLIGTIESRFQGESWPTKNTTPDPCTLMRLVARYLPHGLTHVVMEASSHALAQERIYGIPWACAGFINLTRDHLDFHQDMESYYLAKRRLFMDAPKNCKNVVSGDDEYGERLIQELAQAGRSTRRVASSSNELLLASGLIGDFQKQNISIAIGILRELGMIADGADLEPLLQDFPGVPGRMERVSQTPRVLVDYAHKPEALRQALLGVQPTTQGRLLLVFGCGGDRDRGKRPIMGQIAAQFADHTILTTDNARHEDPDQIIADILSGLTQDQLLKFSIEADRKAAIHLALSKAQQEDTVVIAGKGHETEQSIAGKTFEFDDRKIVRNYFNQ